MNIFMQTNSKHRTPGEEETETLKRSTSRQDPGAPAPSSANEPSAETFKDIRVMNTAQFIILTTELNRQHVLDFSRVVLL